MTAPGPYQTEDRDRNHGNGKAAANQLIEGEEKPRGCINRKTMESSTDIQLLITIQGIEQASQRSIFFIACLDCDQAFPFLRRTRSADRSWPGCGFCLIGPSSNPALSLPLPLANSRSAR